MGTTPPTFIEEYLLLRFWIAKTQIKQIYASSKEGLQNSFWAPQWEYV